jgi:ribosomal protein S18 acetylase RimI-like enzyme
MEKEWKSSNLKNFGRNIIPEEWGRPLTLLAWSLMNPKELVGVAKCLIVGKTVRVSQLLIKDEYRQKKGIGSKLLQEIEVICLKNSFHKIRLSTSEKHQNLEFYKKNGYQIEATLKNDAMGLEWYILSKFPLQL